MICTSPLRCPKRLRLRRVTQHRLDLDVFVEAKLAPLAPVATLLVAAERRVEIKSTVHRDPARTQAARHGAALFQVGAIDVTGEAKGRVIGYFDGVVDIVVTDDAEH